MKRYGYDILKERKRNHKMSEIVKKERNSSIELLRIITMLGVVLLHYNSNGFGGAFTAVEKGSLNYYYLYFVETLFAYAVNLFVMITGYFLGSGGKRKISKVIELIFQVIFFRVLFYLIGAVQRGAGISLKELAICILPMNYFVIIYCALYLISPYLSSMLSSMDQKRLKGFIILTVCLFSCYTFLVDILSIFGNVDGLSTVSLTGSQAGYTIVNFVLVFTVGHYLRVSKADISKGKVLIFLVFMILANYALSLFTTKAWYYNNPLCIGTAAAILYIFKDMHFSSKVINTLAGAAFTCFIVHSYFIKYAAIESFAAKPLYILIPHQFATALGIYLIAFVIHTIYHFVFDRPFKLLSAKIDK